MNSRNVLPRLLPVLLAAACVSTTTRRPPDYAPRPVAELGRWEIREDGELLGHLVHLEIRQPEEPIRYYRIENVRGEWVGHVTGQGLFTRRVPFEWDEEVLGYYPMRAGLARVFEREALPALAPADDARPVEAMEPEGGR